MPVRLERDSDSPGSSLPLSSSELRAQRRYFFCTRKQWGIMLAAGLGAALLGLPWSRDLSVWIPVTVFLLVVTAVHLSFASKFMVPFPHVAILIAGLQYVLAAWLSYYFPASDTGYDIGLRLPQYLAFGCGATIASAFGWAFSLSKIRPRADALPRVSPDVLGELDVLLWFGLICNFSARFISAESLQFALLLCGNLRYVGALGRMLLAGRGWQWRVGLTLALEALLATRQGMLHTLLLWLLSTFVLYLYRFRPSKQVTLGLLLLGFVSLPALQAAKWKLREQSWGMISTEQLSFGEVIENGRAFIVNLADEVYRTVTWNWDPEFVSEAAVRYNTGWIINRVMEYVPSQQPYAKGETIYKAIQAALLPRMLAPDKVRAGGKENYERFTGLTLSGTSMNLGYAGELYANFGFWGALVGCFVYAGLLGLGFRWLASRAARSPLWWVFVPYVGFFAFKAEEGIAEILNWITKAAVIAVLIYLAFPAIRATLQGKDGFQEELTPNRVSASRGSRNRRRRAVED